MSNPDETFDPEEFFSALIKAVDDSVLPDEAKPVMKAELENLKATILHQRRNWVYCAPEVRHNKVAELLNIIFNSVGPKLKDMNVDEALGRDTSRDIYIALGGPKEMVFETK